MRAAKVVTGDLSLIVPILLVMVFVSLMNSEALLIVDIAI